MEATGGYLHATRRWQVLTRALEAVSLAGIERIRRRIGEQLWSTRPLSPAPLGWLRALLQLIAAIAAGFIRDQLLLRAHALAYLTLFALIPLLALMVALVELVGGSEELVSWLFGHFAGGMPERFRLRVLQDVANFNFGALGGGAGGLLLLITILGIGHVERTLNVIWGVTRQRPWSRRVPDYLAVVVVAPVVLGSAASLHASLESEALLQKLLDWPAVGELYALLLRVTPFLLYSVGFLFLYWFLPNTRVRLRPALVGGLVAALLFSAAQSLFLDYLTGFTRSGAVLGSFFSIGLTLFWTYFAWVIVLFGAEVAHACQNIEHTRREASQPALGPAARETLGLAVALSCARAFERGAGPCDAEALSDALGAPARSVREVLNAFREAGIVSTVNEAAGAYQLARPLEQLRVAELLGALRGPRELPLATTELLQVANAVLGQLDQRAAEHIGERSLRDLLARDAAHPAHSVDRAEPLPEAAAVDRHRRAP